MTPPTLRNAERYVGMAYVEGEFDCASLAVLVQRELFGREIALPQAGQRARGRRGQAQDIQTYQPQLADAVAAPSTGDAVVMWGGAEPQRRWHVGTAFVQDGEPWVLHCANEARGVVLQRLAHVLEQGLHLDGCYAWREASPAPTLALAISKPMGDAVQHRTTAAGRTLAETLKGEGVYGDGWAVSVGGREIPPAMWARTRVKPGQLIEARAVMRKQVLMIVAMVVLTYFTFGVGLAAGGAFAAGGAIGGGFLAASAVYVGGSLLISKLLGPKAASAGDMSGAQVPPTYALQGGRNRARPYEPLSLVLGECKAMPDLANQPFAWFKGEDQHTASMFHAGINCSSVADIKLGEAPITNYEEVTVRRYGFPAGNSGKPPVIGTSVDSIAGGALDAPDGNGPWVTRTSSPGTARIDLDIEGTLQNMNSKGKWLTPGVDIEAEYRVVGSTPWLSLGGVITLKNKGPKPLRRTLSYDVDPAQYEVRLRKVTKNSSNTGDEAQLQNTLAWVSLKSYQPDTADYGGQPRVELRMMATGQLNGSPDEVNWIARASGMPLWNGTAWVTVTEPGAAGISNPGAQILMLLRGIYRPSDGRLIAGAGLSDNRIDIESLKGFMVRCAAKNFRFDAFVQEAMTLQDLLESIAAAGLGTLSRHSGRYGVVWMAEDQPIEGVINMASMKARSFGVQYELVTTADEYQLEFFDADRGWTWQPVRVVAPGVTTPQRTSTENVRGVTRADHAATIARFTMGQNVYGRKSITFEMDLEHLVYRRGSVIALSHDLTQWGFGGRLAGITTASGAFTVRVDEPVPTTVQATRTLGLRLVGEQQMRVFNVSSVSPDGRELTVGQAWPAGAPLPGVGSAVHDALWIYDFKATPGYRCRVVSIEPVDAMRGAQITVVPESTEFWNYVLTGEYVPPPNNSLLDAGLPVASNLHITRGRILVAGAWEHELSATWDVVGSYDHAQIWAAPAGAPLELVAANVFGTQHSWRVPSDQTWSVEVRPFDALGRMGTRVATIYTDPSDTVGGVVGLAATVEANGVVLRWTAPQEIEAIGYAATQIRMGLAGATWETASPVFEGRADTCNLGWLQGGTHIIYAAHGNTAGDWSAPASTSLLIAPPSQPVVSGEAWEMQVDLQWTASAGTQPVRAYEVRVGNIYADATVRTVVDALSLAYVADAAGVHMHWVTAIDAGGNRSAAGYVAVEVIPTIQEAIAELQEGLGEQGQAIIDNADSIGYVEGVLAGVQGQIDTINAELADVTGAPDHVQADTYLANALVKSGGKMYRAKINVPAGIAITNTTYWDLVGEYASIGEAVAAHAVQLADHDARITQGAGGLAAEVTARETLSAQLRGNYTGNNINLLTSGLVFSERQARVSGDAANAELTQGVRTDLTEAQGAIAGHGTAISTLTSRADVVDGKLVTQAGRLDVVEAGVGSANADGLVIDPELSTGLAGWSSASTLAVFDATDPAVPAQAPALKVARMALPAADSFYYRKARGAVDSGGLVFRVTPGEVLDLSVWVYLEGTAAGGTTLRVQHGGTNPPANQAVIATYAGAGWQLLAGDFTVPAGSVFARVGVRRNVGPSATEGVVWVAAFQASRRTPGVANVRAAVVAESTARATEIAAEATARETLAVSVGSKNRTYRQNAAPGATGLVAGDVWYDADDGNKSHRWSGTAWVLTDDARISETVASVTTTQQALATLDGKVSASYTLSVQAGTSVAGIRLGTDGAASNFVVLSDKFAWAMPNGTGVKYPLVLGSIAGVASFGFSGNMFVDGALQARMIGANEIRAAHIRSDELETRHHKAGSITADIIAVGMSGNLLANSKLLSADGWSSGDGIGGCVFAVNPSSLGTTRTPAGENILTVYQPANTSGTAQHAYWLSEFVAIEPGQRYGFSVQTGSIRADVEAYIEVYSGTGDYVAGSVIGADATNARTHGGGKSLTSFKRLFGFLVAPSTAAVCRLIVRKAHTIAGQTTSWLLLTQPQISKATPYQTVPSDYSQSGLGTLVTPAVVSTPSLHALSSVIGLLRTASSGQRSEIDDNGHRVYDINNVLRVRTGIW